MRIRTQLSVTLACVTLSLSGCDSGVNGRPTPSTTSFLTPSATATLDNPMPKTLPLIRLDCKPIDMTSIPASHTTIVESIALETRPANGFLRVADNLAIGWNGNVRYFAKTAIGSRDGAEWTLTVPTDLAGEIAIGWGSPAIPSMEVNSPTCTTPLKSAAGWSWWPGGIWAARPGCYELHATSKTGTQVVKLAVGQRC